MEEDNDEKTLNFHEMELDDRILKAIAKLGWQTPTLIQERAIPLLLEGKDVLVRARTGSGKTAAFTIPVIQKIIKCSREVRCVDVAPQVDLSVQKPLLVEKPDIVIGTPARTLQHIKAVAPVIPML